LFCKPLVPGTNLPIGGLKPKVSAAMEKGINRLMLSKYQSSPNLLSE
ncbi:18529_t:CDS:1, partial [Entrophospora sp. SA101]